MLQTPEDPIWRYLTLDKFIAMITHRTLYFTRIDVFADKNEGYCNVAMPEFPTEPPNSAVGFFQHAAMHYQVTTPGMLLKCIFVNCWCSAPSELELMWHRYALTGVTIKSSPKRFLEAFDANSLASWRQLKTGLVTYSADLERDVRASFDLRLGRISYDPQEYLKVAFLKSRHYENDREWRAAFYSNDELLQNSRGWPISFELEHLMEAVYVSPFAPPFLLDALRRLIYGLKLDINIYASGIQLRGA